MYKLYVMAAEVVAAEVSVRGWMSAPLPQQLQEFPTLSCEAGGVVFEGRVVVVVVAAAAAAVAAAAQGAEGL